MSTEHECEERKVEVLLLFALRGGFFIIRNVHRKMSWLLKLISQASALPHQEQTWFWIRERFYRFFLKDFHFHILTWQLVQMIVMIVSYRLFWKQHLSFLCLSNLILLVCSSTGRRPQHVSGPTYSRAQWPEEPRRP